MNKTLQQELTEKTEKKNPFFPSPFPPFPPVNNPQSAIRNRITARRSLALPSRRGRARLPRNLRGYGTFPWHNAPEVGSSVRSEIFVANQPKKHLKLRQERNMALLTELEFMPSSHYRNVAPDGAFNERQGIRGVPRHNEPPPVVGVSCRANSSLLLNPQKTSKNPHAQFLTGGIAERTHSPAAGKWPRCYY